MPKDAVKHPIKVDKVKKKNNNNLKLLRNGMQFCSACVRYVFQLKSERARMISAVSADCGAVVLRVKNDERINPAHTHTKPVTWSFWLRSISQRENERSNVTQNQSGKHRHCYICSARRFTVKQLLGQTLPSRIKWLVENPIKSFFCTLSPHI